MLRMNSYKMTYGIGELNCLDYELYFSDLPLCKKFDAALSDDVISVNVSSWLCVCRASS